MTVAVIVPWRDGVDDYRTRNWEHVRQHLQTVLPHAELIVADDPGLTFSRSRSVNHGVRHTDAETLIFADADIVIPRDRLLEAITVAQTASYVVPFDCRWNLDAIDTLRFMRDEPTHNEQVQNILSAGGVNVVRRSVFVDVGGFDERCVGWGFEDACFDAAVYALHGQATHLTGPAVHLYHPHDPTRDNQVEIARKHALYERYMEQLHDPDGMRRLLAEPDRPGL